MTDVTPPEVIFMTVGKKGLELSLCLKSFYVNSL